ncbi:MAG: hypothetical protein WEC33_02840 [Dehalococcoidia bacterium]
MLAYWISLGAATGGLGGALVGGVGGRLAMFLLRLTSADGVRGIESDDGFIIGRFDPLATAQLILFTALLGSITGLIMVAGRPFFPRRGMALAWGIAGALLGGSILVEADGVDFTVLEPHWLAVSLFVAIPAAGACLIAWLQDLYPRFWWRHRIATAVACLVIVPAIIFVPVGIVCLLVAAAWVMVLRVPAMRECANWVPARAAALVVFAGLCALGAFGLANDMRAIL